ncbi:hypothetical protein [Persicobacter diffluens]|uniref:Uncharacterized protein n=1 Tax=Persicobacter diffluens TaxID=981 RepID=A0AAN4W2R0_9BACT|nr:hypothetical protein PEDI_39720 [Persicobacter diffluens]
MDRSLFRGFHRYAMAGWRGSLSWSMTAALIGKIINDQEELKQTRFIPKPGGFAARQKSDFELKDHSTPAHIPDSIPWLRDGEVLLNSLLQP